MGFLKKLGGDISRGIQAKAEAQRKINLERKAYQKILAEKEKLAHRQAYEQEAVRQTRIRARELARARFQKKKQTSMPMMDMGFFPSPAIKLKVKRKLKKTSPKYTVIGGKAYLIKSKVKKRLKTIKPKPQSQNDLFWRL